MRKWVGRKGAWLRSAARIGLVLLSAGGFACAAYNGYQAYRHADGAVRFVLDKAKTEAALWALSHRLITADVLNGRVEALVDACDIATAESYVAVAEQQGLTLDAVVRRKLDHASPTLCTIRGAVAGAITGEGATAAHIGGAIAADFTVYGDLRDLTKEGIAYLKHEEVDGFIVALSAVGMALTAGTYATSGLTAPAKIGVSLTKFALRGGKLSAAFTRHLAQSVARAFRGRSVKSIDKAAFHRARATFSDIGAVSRATDNVTALRLLKHVDTPKDLKSARIVAEAGGKRTLAWNDAFGARILKTAKSTLKVSAKFLAHLAFLVASLAVAAVSAAFSFTGKRLLRRTLRAAASP